jgi:hypothetical protein
MSSTKINWSNHLVEFAIVTLGILIGFGLNSCNETRKEKKQVQLYLNGIEEELKANKEELLVVHPYHLDLLKKLREEPIRANLVLSPGELTNSAWQLAENPVFKKHIDQATYHTLSSVYSMHDNLIEQSSQAGRLMSEVNILGNFYLSPTLEMDLSEQDTKELAIEFKQGWIPIFESWTSSEKMYLERIDRALMVLGK